MHKSMQLSLIGFGKQNRYMRGTLALKQANAEGVREEVFGSRAGRHPERPTL